MSARPTAIVAGAGGAGTATAHALSTAGFHVIVLDTREASALGAAGSVTDAGGSAEGISVDLLNVEEVLELRDDLLARHGRIDAVIHLVGGWRGSKTLDLASVENWDALHPPIVGTLATLTAVFGEAVRQSPQGRFVMVTSTAAARPTAGNIAYAAAKSAAEAWMAGVAHYLDGTESAAVTIAVKALLTPQMTAADPGKAWPGYTPVEKLAESITEVCTREAANGSRLDLTVTGYSAT